MAKPKKRKRKIAPHRVLGTIKPGHIPVLESVREIIPPDPTQPEDEFPDPVEEHVVVVVPKTAWQRFVQFWTT